MMKAISVALLLIAIYSITSPPLWLSLQQAPSYTICLCTAAIVFAILSIATVIKNKR